MKKFFLALGAGLAIVCSASAWAGPVESEWIPAEVVKVDAPRKLVTLKHGPIDGLKMAAMTMPFKVKEADQLKTLKAGDKIHFHVMMEDGEPVIHHLEVQK